MIAECIMLLFMLLAVWYDFNSWHIPNWLILMGGLAGSICQYVASGFQGLAVAHIRAILVIILLFLLFHMRALGAGDIKLLSMTGLFLETRDHYYCVIAAFVTAALFSALKLVLQGNLWERFHYFFGYVMRCVRENTIGRYRDDVVEQSYMIHFSLSALIGYLLYLEVFR